MVGQGGADPNRLGVSLNVGRGFYSPPPGGILTDKSTDQQAPAFRIGSADERGSENIVSSSVDGVRPIQLRHHIDFSPHRYERRPLINPFKPSEFSVRITSNRRRWIHVFPVDSRGFSKQAHHYVEGKSTLCVADVEETDPTQMPEPGFAPGDVGEASTPVSITANENTANVDVVGPLRQRSVIGSAKTAPTVVFPLSDLGPSGTASKGKTLIWAWGPTGEEQWNPDIEIGVDWKSFVLPSCLPITTDFFPDARSLKNDYFFNEHSIDLGDTVERMWHASASLGGGDCRTAVFNELVCQRLQQGKDFILPVIDYQDKKSICFRFRISNHSSAESNAPRCDCQQYRRRGQSG